MTTQEALEALKIEQIVIEGKAVRVAKFFEGISVANEALEKQIPKKPIKKNPVCYAKTKDGQEYYTFDYFCPRCNEQIKLSEHHCKCGQALDWSDTE